jgi:hypothetical protein
LSDFDSLNITVNDCRTIILGLSAFLHECGISYFTLMEEHRFRAFDSKVLKRIFGPSTEEVTR